MLSPCGLHPVSDNNWPNISLWCRLIPQCCGCLAARKYLPQLNIFFGFMRGSGDVRLTPAVTG